MSINSEIQSRRLRFTNGEDLTLLREIIANNPFEDFKRWQLIHDNVVSTTERPFTVRAVKERLEYLLKSFNKENTIKRKRSGTEKDVTEIQKLLQEIKDLQRDFAAYKPRKLSKAEKATSSCASTEETSEAVEYLVDSNGEVSLATTFIRDIEDQISVVKTEETATPTASTFEIPQQSPNSLRLTLTPSHSHKSNSIDQVKNSALLYLEQENEAEQVKQDALKLEERKLILEERKIAVEERKIAHKEAKLELEKMERLERLKMDKETHNALLEQNTKLMSFFINQMEANNQNY